VERSILTVTMTPPVMATVTGGAWADPGPPGSTYPEQPGGHVATACSAVGTNPGAGIGCAFEQHASPPAAAILTGLYIDVCLGG
jgi:hypothetical protein